jgi:hypothetical protein
MTKNINNIKYIVAFGSHRSTPYHEKNNQKHPGSAEASVERRFGRAGVQGGVLIHRFCGSIVNRIIKAKKMLSSVKKLAKSSALVKTFHITLGKPLWKAPPASGWVYPLISHCRKGKWHQHFQTHVSTESPPIPVILHLLQHTPAMLAVPWLKVTSTPLEIWAVYPRSQIPFSQQGCPSHVPWYTTTCFA